MSAWNTPNPESSTTGEERWTRPPVPPTPAKIPVHYTPEPGHAAGRKVLGFALFLLFVGAVGAGAWFYFKTHPLRLEEANSTAGKPLPRSGDSPSAYRYVMGRLRRHSARRTDDASPPAPAVDAGTVTIEGMSFKLSDSIDDFLAEVIDGDRHYFIRFRRVPRLVVTTKDPARVSPPPAALRATAIEPAGEEVYLSQNGWWRLTRTQNMSEKAVAASVVLNVFLTPDGRVERSDVVSGSKEMAAAALEAVKHWRYDAPSNGAPPQKRIVVNFSVAPQ